MDENNTKLTKLMKFNPWCYSDADSFFGLFLISCKLEEFIDENWKHLSKIGEKVKEVMCSTDGCQMMKWNLETTRKKLEEVKRNIGKLKKIGYFNARKALAEFFKKLPDVVVDMIFKHLIEIHKEEDDDIDGNIFHLYPWHVERDLVWHDHDHGALAETYNFVSSAIVGEIRLYNWLKKSRNSLYHYPLVINVLSLEKPTTMLAQYLNQSI